MKKRLTAWLLVFCMALSLLPGTAFAAENSGGGDDGKATIFYHLNDGKSSYTLQLKTTPGQEPENSPGAIWSGRPFLGWTQQDKVSAPTYSNNEHLYAQWSEGYKVNLDFNAPSTSSTLPTTPKEYTTGSDGKIKAENVTEIEKIISDYLNTPDGKSYAFSGWDIDGKPFDLATDRVPSYGATIQAKWDEIYTVKFIFNDDSSYTRTVSTGAGGKIDASTNSALLQELADPEKAGYAKDGYTFEGWYIVNTAGTDSIPTGTLSPDRTAPTKGFEVDPTASFAEYGTPGTTIEVSANWGPPYNIIFDANGGYFGNNTRDTEKQVETNGNGQLQLPQNPQKEYSTFLGWATNKTATEATIKFDSNGRPIGTLPIIGPNDVFDTTSSTKKPKTYYAVWEDQVTITIDYQNNKKVVLPALQDDGKTPIVYPDFASKYLTLAAAGERIPSCSLKKDEWVVTDKDDNTISTPDGAAKWTDTQFNGFSTKKSVTITATWKPGYYITFDLSGGTDQKGTPYGNIELFTGDTTTPDAYHISKDTIDAKTGSGTGGLNVKAPPQYDSTSKIEGWYTDSACRNPKDADPNVSGGTSYKFDSEETLYAKWEAIYRITYNANGGTIATGTETAKTQADGTLSQYLDATQLMPPQDKYNEDMQFTGWYLDRDCKNPVSLDHTFTAHTTIYAGWQENDNSINIIYTHPSFATTDTNFSKGTELPTLLYQTGGTYIYPVLPAPTSDHYNFEGWYRDDKYTSTQLATSSSPAALSEAEKQAGTITLYAKWESKPAGTSFAPASLQAAPAPIKKPASVPALQAANPGISALAESDELEVTFNLNYQSTSTGFNPVLKTETIKKGESLGDKLPTAEDVRRPNASGNQNDPDDYLLAGWYTGEKEADDASAVTPNTPITDAYDPDKNGKLTLYAHWNPRITFNAGEGTFSGPPQVKAITLYATKNKITNWPTPPVRSGYTFAGWFDTSNKQYVPSDTFTEHKDLTAHWTKDHYTVTFDLGYDGATPIEPLPTTTHKDTTSGTESEILATLPSPTRAGYEFAGWWTSESQGDQVQASHVFTQNTTLYARWRQVFTITFEHNNGTGQTTVKTVASGGTLGSTPVDAPTYKGYVFQRWLRKDDNTPYSSSMTFSADTTFYAEWKEQIVTVTFNPNDPKDTNGVPVDSVTNEITTLTTSAGRIEKFPTLKNHRGYTLLGWFTTADGTTGTKVGLDGPWPAADPDGKVTVYARWQKNALDAGVDGRVIFIVDIDPMPTDEKAQDELAHFTMEPTNGYLQQYPVLSLDTASGWHKKGDTVNVDTNTKYETTTYLYVGTAKRYPITLDWQYEDDTGSPVITVISTDDDGILRNWPETDNVRPDSTFKGWYTEKTGGTQVPEDTPFTGPTTIYAQWKSPYKITFDANGGQWEEDGKTETTKTVSTSKDGILATADIPANPTREGYKTFVGWGLTKDATEKVNPATYGVPYEGPVTFYAIWGPPYEIKYNVMGGNEFTPTEAQSWSTEDGKYPELPVPTHSRDTFGGWYTTETFDEGTLAETGGDCPGAVTLYAKWNHEPPYNIIFNANLDGAVMEDPTSGSSVTTLTLKTDDKGVLLQAPPEPTIRGGKFQGWYTKAEEGTGELISDIATHVFEDDTTLYAHWDTMEFTITFDFNLSSIGKDFNITTYTTTKGKSLSFLPGELPQAASETKKIEGWYTVPNPVAGKDQPVTTSNTFERDTTLYAKWVDAPDLPIVFKYPNVTFLDAENGNAMVTLEVDKDYKMASVPPGPYKEGLTFSGWFYREPDRPDGEEKQFTKDTEVTGSLRVYPKYVGSGYTVTFEPGEESELDPIKVKTTSEGRIPDGSMPSPTWEGHTFAGWYTSAEGGTKITRRTVFTQDTTVYAHWDSSSGPEDPDDPDKPDKPGPTSPPFTITFNPNGGNLNANTTALTDLNGRLMSLPTPARTGYHFDGWYNGNERVTTATVFSANTTITAQWSTGSGGGSGDSGSGELNGYAITVSNTSGGRVSVSTTYAREGDRVTVTVRPYSGYQLDRVDVVNARGYDVELRDQGSNRYVFYMPASRVTVDAVFMELIANTGNGGNTGNSSGSTGGNTSWNPGGSTGGNTSWNPGGTTSGTSSGLGIFSQPVLNTVPMPYLDVHASDWYYSSVDYMWQRQLMGGVSSNRFGPQATTSNAMVWTILARLAGVDVTSGASVWYENARSWAVSNRISDGVGPNSAVTREQLATMLWNFKGSPAASYDLGQFGDRGQISTYQAECALGWAVANGIVSGTGNRLNPRGTATRAEVAAMITRFCQNT